jgi:N-acetylmuramoyl-L-alanine amidase
MVMTFDSLRFRMAASLLLSATVLCVGSTSARAQDANAGNRLAFIKSWAGTIKITNSGRGLFDTGNGTVQFMENDDVNVDLALFRLQWGGPAATWTAKHSSAAINIDIEEKWSNPAVSGIASETWIGSSHEAFDIGQLPASEQSVNGVFGALNVNVSTDEYIVTIPNVFSPVPGSLWCFCGLVTHRQVGPNLNTSEQIAALYTDGMGVFQSPPALQISGSITRPYVSPYQVPGSQGTETVDYGLTAKRRVVVLDPGHGLIQQKDGTLAYQRPATPTYHLREDNLTLDMAQTIKQLLTGPTPESLAPIVYMTRTGSRAPFAPVGCAVPCFADIRKRREAAIKQDADLMISIHTNANDDRTAHGTETYFGDTNAKSFALANDIGKQVGAISSKLHAPIAKGFNIIETPFPSALIEVAYHSNSVRAKDELVTDEFRLSETSFRSAVAQKIIDGSVEFVTTQLSSGD